LGKIHQKEKSSGFFAFLLTRPVMDYGRWFREPGWPGVGTDQHMILLSIMHYEIKYGFFALFFAAANKLSL
jgi:hypothetical protein